MTDQDQTSQEGSQQEQTPKEIALALATKFSEKALQGAKSAAQWGYGVATSTGGKKTTSWVAGGSLTIATVFGGISSFIHDNLDDSIAAIEESSFYEDGETLKKGECFYQRPNEVKRYTFEPLREDDFKTGFFLLPRLLLGQEVPGYQGAQKYNVADIPVIRTAFCDVTKPELVISERDVRVLVAETLYDLQNSSEIEALEEKFGGAEGLFLSDRVLN